MCIRDSSPGVRRPEPCPRWPGHLAYPVVGALGERRRPRVHPGCAVGGVHDLGAPGLLRRLPGR
eukprot:5061010-Pyramimonas_sp.AAC.1